MGHPDTEIDDFLNTLPGSFRTVTLAGGEKGFAGFAFNAEYIRHHHTELRRPGESFVTTLKRARDIYAEKQPTVFNTAKNKTNLL